MLLPTLAVNGIDHLVMQVRCLERTRERGIDIVAADEPREPKYYLVKRHLLDFITELDPGSAVPTEGELAD